MQGQNHQPEPGSVSLLCTWGVWSFLKMKNWRDSKRSEEQDPRIREEGGTPRFSDKIQNSATVFRWELWKTWPVVRLES